MSDYDATPATPRDRSVCDAVQQGQRCPMVTPPLAIDVSHWQGAIDWPAVAAWSGAGGFAYVKVTEGSSVVDDMAPHNLAAMRAAGLRAGVYHFARFVTVEQAEREAAHFIATYEHLYVETDVLPALDLEEPQAGHADIGTPALAWLDRVAETLGFAPVVYVSPAFAIAHGFAKHAPRLAEFPLWVAHYADTMHPMPCPPWGADDWVMWQYTARGRVPGVATPVDINHVRQVPL